MPASREMESEADHIGCELLARACFNPQESINFWHRMSQAEKKAAGIVSQEGGYLNTWEFFSTHPATSRRIADIQNGCRSCCKLENLRDAMSMEDFIILIRVTSVTRVVINTWVCMFHDLSSILCMVPRLEVLYHCA